MKIWEDLLSAMGTNQENVNDFFEYVKELDRSGCGINNESVNDFFEYIKELDENIAPDQKGEKEKIDESR